MKIFDFNQKFKNIVVLTGAGISQESGIATFRDSGGLWENYNIKDVATPIGFRKNPKLVQNFYNERRKQCKTVNPNAAHIALANFEQRHTGNFLLVTQNVDDLHERAGSQNIIHMHGEFNKIRCDVTGLVYSCNSDISVETLCECCEEPNRLRPHVVWFGEMPFFMEKIEEAVISCDLFVSIGTSGQVYPAAGYKDLAKDNGAKIIELNLETTPDSYRFHMGFYGKASEEVPLFFESINVKDC